MQNRGGGFSFVDEGEALRRLGVDRDMMQALTREGRLRAYPGVGKGNFYRMRDIDALLAEFGAGAAPAPGEETSAPGAAASRKVFDPAYKVHVRLQADLKWYDLEDEDLQAWAREMTSDGYARQRTNITRVIGKLERLIELMDAQAASWKYLAPAAAPAPAPPAAGEASMAAEHAGDSSEDSSEEPPRRASRRGQPLTMASAPGAGDPPPAPAQPNVAPITLTPRKRKQAER